MFPSFLYWPLSVFLLESIFILHNRILWNFWIKQCCLTVLIVHWIWFLLGRPPTDAILNPECLKLWLQLTDSELCQPNPLNTNNFNKIICFIVFRKWTLARNVKMLIYLWYLMVCNVYFLKNNRKRKVWDCSLPLSLL